MSGRDFSRRYTRVSSAASLEADRLLEQTCARLGALPFGGTRYSFRGIPGCLGKSRVVKRKSDDSSAHQNAADKALEDVENALKELAATENEQEGAFQKLFTKLRDVKGSIALLAGFQEITRHIQEALDDSVDFGDVSACITSCSKSLAEKEEGLVQQLVEDIKGSGGGSASWDGFHRAIFKGGRSRSASPVPGTRNVKSRSASPASETGSGGRRSASPAPGSAGGGGGGSAGGSDEEGDGKAGGGGAATGDKAKQEVPRGGVAGLPQILDRSLYG